MSSRNAILHIHAIISFPLSPPLAKTDNTKNDEHQEDADDDDNNPPPPNERRGDVDGTEVALDALLLKAGVDLTEEVKMG